MQSKIGLFSLLASGLLAGISSILIRLLNKDMSSYQQIFLRNVLGFFFIAVILFMRKTSWSKIKKVQKRYLVLYGFSIPTTIILYTISILLTKIALTFFAAYVGSITTSFLVGKFVFKEKIHPVSMISFLFVIIALCFLSFPVTVTSLSVGLAFGLASGVFDALSNSFRKHLGNTADHFILVSIAMAGGLLLSIILMVISKQNIFFFNHLSMQSWVIAVLFSFLVILAFYLPIFGFQNFDLHMGTIILSSEIIFAPLLAYLIFRETLSITQILGGILIAIAILTPQFFPVKKAIRNKKYH